MARLIDERPTEDVEEKDINTLEQDPQAEETLEEPEADVPEKYQGKSTAEIVREKNSWKEVRQWARNRESHMKYERKQGISD